MRPLLLILILAGCPSKDDASDDDTDVPVETDSDTVSDAVVDTDTDTDDTDACGPLESFTLHGMNARDLAARLEDDDLLPVVTGPAGGAQVDLGLRATGVPQYVRIVFELRDEQGATLLSQEEQLLHVALAPLDGPLAPWTCRGKLPGVLLYVVPDPAPLGPDPDDWITPYCGQTATLSATLSAFEGGETFREIATTSVTVELDPSRRPGEDDPTDPCADQ